MRRRDCKGRDASDQPPLEVLRSAEVSLRNRFLMRSVLDYADMVADLHALLTSAGVADPYVLMIVGATKPGHL
jgi:hypothetical protein